MRLQPGADRLQGDVLRVQRVAGDQLAADCSVRVAVLGSEADSKLVAVLQTDAARALDLEEKGAHRVVHPGDLQLAAGEKARVDRLAVPIGKKLTLHRPSGRPLSL